uniref:Big-1 domain-containing protein n=2 Tax=Tetradesmus obliquus TaxID=3088 RepID=A0A383WCX9_TETOB
MLLLNPPGMTCFYNGASDNWKVCSSSACASSPTKNADATELDGSDVEDICVAPTWYWDFTTSKFTVPTTDGYQGPVCKNANGGTCSECVGNCCIDDGACPTSSCIANGLGTDQANCPNSARCPVPKSATCEKHPNCNDNKLKCLGYVKCTAGAPCPGWEGAGCFYLGNSQNWKVCSDPVCDRKQGKAVEKTMPEDVCNPKGGKKGDADRCVYPEWRQDRSKTGFVGRCDAADPTTCIGNCNPTGACKSSSCIANALGDEELNCPASANCPVRNIASATCVKDPSCTTPHCFGWLSCPGGCTVNGYNWEGVACFYDGKSSNYKVCTSTACNAQVSSKSLPATTSSSSTTGRSLLQGSSGKGRGKGLKFAKLNKGYSKANLAAVCSNPTSAPALADLGGELFLTALGMRLAILKDRIENRACEDAGKPVVYLDEVVMKSTGSGYPECDCYTAEMLLIAMNANLADVQATYGQDTTGTTGLPLDWCAFCAYEWQLLSANSISTPPKNRRRLQQLLHLPFSTSSSRQLAQQSPFSWYPSTDSGMTGICAVQTDTASTFTVPAEAPVTVLEISIPTPSKQVNNQHTLQATYTCDGTATAGAVVTFTLMLSGTQTPGTPATVTCTTDASGACSATVPASATAVKYDVTASAPNCGGASNPGTTTATVKTGSGSTIEWTSTPAAPNTLTLTIAKATVNVGQTNEVQATLQCATPMPAGTTVTFSFKVAGTNTAVPFSPAVTCTTDNTGTCKATVPASSSAVSYDVTASSTCQTTPITSTSSTINWTGTNGITLTIAKPSVNVGQTNEVQANLQCATPMPAGTTVTFSFKVAGTSTAVPFSPAITCVTDNTGMCKATVPASSSAVSYDVTVSSNCQGTAVTSPPSTINWTGTNGITLTIAKPTVNVGQTNEVQANLQCATPMPAGTTVTFSFKLAGTNTAVPFSPAVTCVTDNTGMCKATVPASSTAVSYDVTASSTCQGTAVTSTPPGTINWIAAGPNSLLQAVDQPTKNVGQPNEVQATLQCNGVMQPGSVVTFTLTNGTSTVATITCTTDSAGKCKATIPASFAVTTYDVTASALCGTTPVTALKTPVNWVAVPGQLLLNIPQPVLPVKQNGTLEAQLNCGGIMTPGSTVTFDLKNSAGTTMFTFTAVTDANGLAKVTLPAEAAAVKYGVTATATPACGSNTGSVPATPKPGSGTTIEWIAQPDTLNLTATPNARVLVGTDITVTGKLVSGTTPVTGKVINFEGVQPDGTKVSAQCTTQADGSCNVKFVRPTPDQLSVTASATGSSGSPVTTPVPLKLEWYSNAPDQLLLSLVPDRRVPAGTTVKVSANYSEEGKPVANKEITFTVEKSDKTFETLKATTDKDGIASISLVRPTPDEATVTAATKSSSGKDVTSPTPANIVWFSTAPDQLTLDLDHGTRVVVKTVVTVTATYTEEGKPVADRTISFNIKNPDGTQETLTAKTDAAGKANIQLVKADAYEVKVTASATSTSGKTIDSGAEAHIIWYHDSPDELVLSLTPSARVPVNTTVLVFATYSESGVPVANKPITFKVTTSAGRVREFVVNTNDKGVAWLTQTRLVPEEATVTASAVNSKTNLPVVSDVPMQIIWYSTAGEQLQLNIGHGTRVLVGTTVPVTATYTEDGSPVPNREITFTLKALDGTKTTQRATTNAKGQATITLVKQQPDETEVVASTISTKGQPVSSTPPAHVIWYAPEQLDLALNPGARVPVTTRVQVTAVYTEQDKPVAGRTVSFAVKYDDGTTVSPTAVTDTQGAATVTLVRQTPSVATVAASTTSSQNKPVAASSGVIITWFDDKQPLGGPEQLVLAVIQPLVNVGETADVQAYYSINSKPVGGATVTFQLRDPKTNTPVGKTYTANTDTLGVARVTVDASPVTIVRLVGASTPSSSSPGTVVTGVLDPLSSPSITWVSQQLVIYPTPNARMPSDSTITVVAVYSESGNPVANRPITLTAVNADKTTDTVTLTSDADGQVFWPRTRTVQGTAIEEAAVVQARTTSTNNVAVASTSIGEGRSADSKTTTLTWFKDGAETLALTIPDPIVPPGKPVTVEACYTVDGKPQSGQVIAFTLVDPETRAPSGATYTSTTGADCKAVAQIPASPTEDVKVVSAALLRSTKRITGFFVAQSADSITWSKDQLELTLAPNARVRVTTRVRVSATYVVDTKPKANQPITFDIKYSDGTKDTRTANTNARGVATIPLVRNVVSVAEVVASTKSSAGKTVSSVSVGAGASSNAGKSVIQWYDDGTAEPLLQLTLKPSARVPVSTTVTVTASYTEAGKPVAGRTIAFAAAFRDGTRATLSGITNAAGQATADLVKDVPIIADVTASTTSTAGQPVSGSGKSVIEWYAAPAGDTDGLTMSFLIGKSIPIGVLSCTSIKRDQVDVQLAAAISADIVKQSSGLGDSSLTAKNVPVTMTSCSDQPPQLAMTFGVQFTGASPTFLKVTKPRLAKLILGGVDGQSVQDTCGTLPTTCKVLTSNYASLLGSCSAATTRTSSKPCKVGSFTANKMCPLGIADSKPSASNKGNLWAGTFLPQPGGSCTVMACNVDAGSSCFPLYLDLLKPPATSKTNAAAVAATATVSCINGQLVGDFKAAAGYTVANARVQSTCGQTWKDAPKYCPYRAASLSAGAQAAAFTPVATTAARVVSKGITGCLCPSGCAPFVWVDADISAKC